MSWNDYVSGYLINYVSGSTTVTGACEHGALVGQDGTIWAATEGFKINPKSQVDVSKEDGTSEKISINEFDHVKDALKHKGATNKMKKGGVHLLGQKLVATNGNEGEGYYTQYFKTPDGGYAISETSKGNFIIAKWNQSKKCTVVHDGKSKEEKQSPGNCNNAVDNLSKVLVAAGL